MEKEREFKRNKQIYDKIDNTVFKPCKSKGYDFIPTFLPAVERIIAIGDIHGDYELAIEYLKLAKVATINDNGITWIGGNTVVVQMGDQIDRCRPNTPGKCANPKYMEKGEDENSDIKILKLFTELHTQALKDGGKVISLLGNHELMNVQGKMQYVSYDGIVGFSNNNNYKEGLKNRIESFGPGNIHSKFMACTRVPFIFIGSNLFIHAGYMFNATISENFKNLSNLRTEIFNYLHDNKGTDTSLNDNIFWRRDFYKNMKSNKVNLDKMELMNINNIIVGHTPQFANGIAYKPWSEDKLRCLNQKQKGMWFIDNGSSKAFHIKALNNPNKKNIRILEIINNNDFNILINND